MLSIHRHVLTALEAEDLKKAAALWRLFPQIDSDSDFNDRLKVLWQNSKVLEQQKAEQAKPRPGKLFLEDSEGETLFNDPFNLATKLKQPVGIDDDALKVASKDAAVMAWIYDSFELLTGYRPEYSERTIKFGDDNKPILGPHIRFQKNKQEAACIMARLDGFYIPYALMAKENGEEVISVPQNGLPLLFDVLDSFGCFMVATPFVNHYKSLPKREGKPSITSDLQARMSTYFDLVFKTKEVMASIGARYDKLDSYEHEAKNNLLLCVEAHLTSWIIKNLRHCIPMYYDSPDSKTTENFAMLSKLWDIPKLNELNVESLTSVQKWKLFGLCVAPEELFKLKGLEFNQDFVTEYCHALSKFMPDSVRNINEPTNAQPLTFSYGFDQFSSEPETVDKKEKKSKLSPA